MALLTILEYPDERLRVVADPVAQFDDDLRTLVDDMAETMYDAPGVGLAATQVAVSQRVFIIDIADEEAPSDLKVFVNPEIVETSGNILFDEGCLSFPGINEGVKRAMQVEVRAKDALGKDFELKAEGLFAVAIQHENDHLNGVLMIDKLGSVKRRLVARKLSQNR